MTASTTVSAAVSAAMSAAMSATVSATEPGADPAAGRLRDAVLRDRDEAGERRRLRQDAANDSERAARVVIDDLPAFCPRALEAGCRRLAAMLAASGSSDLLQIHLEHVGNDPSCPWRLRQRRLTGLDQQCHADDAVWRPFADTLDWLIERVDNRREACRARLLLVIDGERHRINIERWRSIGDNTATWSIQLCGNDDVSLDQRFLAGRGLTRWRDALQEKRGLMLIACRDEWHLEQLATTLARDLVAPDRRLLHGSRNPEHALPLTLTVNTASAHVENDAFVRACRADVDVIISAMPALRSREREVLAQQATNCLTLQFVIAASPAAAFESARIGGWSNETLETRLHTIVVEHRVAALCRECRTPSLPNAEDVDFLARFNSPADAAQLPRWFEVQSSIRWYRAPGCHVCRGSGVTRLASIAEVVNMLPGSVTSNISGRFRRAGDSRHHLDARSSFARELLDTCRAGNLSLSEASRLI
ncbi:MAG: hypothetical protein CSB44_10765 [Gammaproteobacteria bacterium]|nr:MAG: hypothetical protein CSB44_10765 [Gammaproteobacteria bacterium]PIE36436.1 MAG: hypothetical protein CSA54_04400 [Gammaproteobacteria bacterium]